MKNLKKSLSYVTSPFTLGIIVTAAITLLSARYYSLQHNAAALDENSVFSIIRQIHEKTIDFRLKDRGEKPGSDRVAILAIDEKSIEQEGRWPWSRAKIATLIDRAISGGAKSVSFDIIFSEEDGNASIPTLNRLRRTLGEKQRLTSDVDSLISSEIDHADSDRAFASTIAFIPDSLVLGSYFEEYDAKSEARFEPYQEFCLDAIYERTPESRYWKKERIQLEIADPVNAKINLQKELKAWLTDYFTPLEIEAASRWFDHHAEKTPHIEAALREIGSPFPPESFPGISALWLNGNTELLQDLLAQTLPPLANKEGVAKVLVHFSSAFSRKETAMLQQSIRSSGESYCRRFGTSQDDLLSLEAYEKQWGKRPDNAENFKALALSSFWASLQKANPSFASESFEQGFAKFKNDARANAVHNVFRWWVNIPLLAEPTHHSGYFNAFLDSDGSVRRSALFVRRGNFYTPSLAMKTFLLDKGYTAKATIDLENPGKTTSSKVVKSYEILDKDKKTVMTIPVDGKGQLMINYAGPRNMYPYISAADILSDSPNAEIEIRERDEKTGRAITHFKTVNKKEFLKDKLLIAGATATGIYDLRVTPFEENYPGVETHANVLSNILTEHSRQMGEKISADATGFMRTSPLEEHYMWMVLAVIGLALSGLLTYFGSITGLAITAIAIIAVYAIDKFLIFGHGTVVIVFFPMLMISATFVSLTFYKYFTEERKKRELKGTFEKYVSPAIVAEVLSDPENIELGGKKMELTVMFSDVRGFTTISEKLDPRALSDLLNSYLTPMTNLVFTHKGTLDKYMGDAIMAFWGAPIHFPDHAKHACRCALEMLDKLKELQEEYRAKGLPEIDIGIGLNTGDMSVGNMGSDTVRSYTVMGDAVNLGSRLEGINKQYGTRIIISEFTLNAIKDDFVTREVDWVRVKGKAQPVRIFELVGEIGKVDEKRRELIKLFDEGFKLYHAREFTTAVEVFKQALEIESHDACTQLYIERCEDYVTEPPSADWDGVYTMKTK